jgi:A/G-specific adenine glycosylase
MTGSISSRLLAWYGGRDRDVPWRGDTDPYRVWVAEVMAQQTRIDTVRGYHRAFLERFPDIQTLAGASLDEVLTAWQGLGYYSRARNLHATAERLVADRGGVFPETAAELMELPGIGRYTAGAIASFAFGEASPAVDGNARRVLARVFDLAGTTPAALDAAARALLADAPGHAADLNQALMDLGGDVCSARSPRCDVCPLRGACLALANGTRGERPFRPPRKTRPRRAVAAAAVRRRGRVLMIRRPVDGLLGGLWDLPWVELDADSDAEASLTAKLETSYGIVVRIAGRLAEIDHVFSHFRLRLEVFSGVCAGGAAPASDASVWLQPHDLGSVATPTYLRTVIPLLTRHTGGAAAASL